MDHLETKTYDVLVIGAGGAGLRAAIEAVDQGVSVAVVCKSLLGKAHTVMAEGGVAAALATTDSRDGWRVHFRDTMRGGKLLNDWRMAQLLAQEAPARVRELEAWGALFDRTPDGRILQRNFGGHQYPRLAHVGDRTGLEMIRTLQDRTVQAQRIDVFMECTVARLLTDDGRISGALTYRRENSRNGQFHAEVAVVDAASGELKTLTHNNAPEMAVQWSPEDLEFVATVLEFPSLSWLDEDQFEALRGIERLVSDVIDELAKSGEPPARAAAGKVVTGSVIENLLSLLPAFALRFRSTSSTR